MVDEEMQEPGIFFPMYPKTREQIRVRVSGVIRHDWEFQYLDDGSGVKRQAIVFPAMTYEERCTFSIQEVVIPRSRREKSIGT